MSTISARLIRMPLANFSRSISTSSWAADRVAFAQALVGVIAPITISSSPAIWSTTTK